MAQRTDETRSHIYARVAGAALILMALLAVFANFFVLESLIVPDNAAETASNIVENEVLFRGAIASFMVIVLLDVLVAWALYAYFRPVHEQLARLAAWLRLIYAPVLGVAVFNHLSLVQLLSGTDSAQMLQTGQIHSQVMSYTNAFTNAWMIGLVLFGLHLLVLGYLMIKSGSMPTIIGALLMIAGLAYLADSFAFVQLTNYSAYEPILLLVVAVPGVVGELSFAFWLLLRRASMPGRQDESQPSTP